MSLTPEQAFEVIARAKMSEPHKRIMREEWLAGSANARFALIGLARKQARERASEQGV